MFETVLWTMAALGLVVFVALYFVDAGYGKMISPKWGPTLPNKLGWVLMECPVFFVVLALWASSGVRMNIPYLVFLLFFEFHYFYRSFLFPLRLSGRSRMPLAIVLMSICFNLINGYIQGWWLFRIAPQLGYYTPAWVYSPQFIIGTAVFFSGMMINRRSDRIVRSLRSTAGDTRHYFPTGGFYNYVTSANYFGEIVEWLGWAILTWSMAGVVFFWFTCANLVPRANSIWHKYAREFPEEFAQAKPKRIIPFIY